MFSKKPEASSIQQLSAELKEKKQSLEKYFTVEGGMELRALSPKELSELKKEIDGLDTLQKKFDAILDKESVALQSYGMSYNKKTGNTENVFAKHPTAKVVDGKAWDDSTYSKEDNFSDVIKKGYAMEWVRAPDIFDENKPEAAKKKNRAGFKRDQACLFTIEQFVQNTKKQNGRGDQFVLDLINFRSATVQVYGSAYDVRDYIAEFSDPKLSDGQKEHMHILMGAQLRNAMSSSTLLVQSLEKIHNYNHVMSSKDFITAIPKDHKKNQLLSNIRQALVLLDDNNNSAQSHFWSSKKQKPKLDDASRIAQLIHLQIFIIEAKKDAGLNSNPAIKNTLNNLSEQIEYGISKLDGELRKAAVAAQVKENIAPSQLNRKVG